MVVQLADDAWCMEQWEYSAVYCRHAHSTLDAQCGKCTTLCSRREWVGCGVVCGRHMGVLHGGWGGGVDGPVSQDHACGRVQLGHCNALCGVQCQVWSVRCMHHL